MDGDWDEVARLALPPPGRHAVSTPVATMAFDTIQELLWVANDYGRVTSFYSTELQRHTSFKAHDATDGPVKLLLFNDRGVIALGPKSVHMATRRGTPIWHITHDDMKDLRCMSFTSKGTGEILVAGMSDQMFVIDVHRGEITRKISTPDSYIIMKRSRYICAATTKGAVNLLDPITFNIVKTWNAHSSMISDMDSQHDYIVTCGYSLRQQNSYMLDPLVNVFDLKNLISLPPIPFPAGAAYVRMHPRMSTTSIVVSQLGQMHIVDLMNVNTSNVRQANVLSYLTMIEIAPSGEAIALADSECNVHLWGSPSRIRFAELSNPVEFANPEEEPEPMEWDNAPLSTIGMPYYREQLLSAWPTHLVSDIGAPPEKIDPKFMSSLSPIEYGLYGRNTRGTKRNQASNTRLSDKSSGGLQAPKFLSERARESQGSGSMDRRISDAADTLGAAEISSLKAEVPFMYRNVEIKYSKFGIDDFDFGFYNKTRYSGLETHISNSYANSVLQLLHYTPLVRNMALQHAATSCLNPLCLLCEMGFLFDMLEKAEGSACQATNLLRAFSNNSEAVHQNLVEEETAGVSQPLPLLIQKLTPFLLGKMAMDYKSIPPHSDKLDQALLTSATTTIKCMNCRNEHTRPGNQYVNELIYPLPKSPARNARTPKVSFSQVLKQSVERETTSRGWCSRCQRYQSLATRKTIHKVPQVLMINAMVLTPEAKVLWGTPGWLPDEIGIIVDQAGQFFCYEGEDLKLHLQRGIHTVTVYSLIGLAADIESGQHQKSHLVSLINVVHSQPNAQTNADNWHLFNDFLVRPVKMEEAISFNTSWKQPSVIAFQIKSENNRIDDSWKQSLDTSLLHRDQKYDPHIATSHPQFLHTPHMWQIPEFYEERELINHSISPNPIKTYTPLQAGKELPAPGSVIALDTEFVSIRRPEIEVNSDGDRETIRPIAYALARVSVLRGPGPPGSFDIDLEPGTPFIDDYVTLTSPVVDYLTSYSGIKAADLDPAVSPHSLVPLKTAYKKLWLLLNLGCSFLGHGLKQDFRVINIHVPKSQVIDTGEFFFLPNKFRKLSLAFLAWYLLKEEIQLETHDSIEDARTALKLWNKWKEFVDAGVQEQMLSEIYRKGRELNFKPPGRGEGSAMVFNTPTKASAAP